MPNPSSRAQQRTCTTAAPGLVEASQHLSSWQKFLYQPSWQNLSVLGNNGDTKHSGKAQEKWQFNDVEKKIIRERLICLTVCLYALHWGRTRVLSCILNLLLLWVNLCQWGCKCCRFRKTGDCCYLAPAPCTPQSTKASQTLLLPPAMLLLHRGLGHSIQNICTIHQSVCPRRQTGQPMQGCRRGKPRVWFWRWKEVREQMAPVNRSGSPGPLPKLLNFPNMNLGTAGMCWANLPTQKMNQKLSGMKSLAEV